MARSVRALIDFLISEIALCGDRGASPSDILAAIETFYSSPGDEKLHVVDAVSYRKPIIDRRFQERVWTWLIRNPEVSVGRSREGNELTLAEAEAAQGSPSANFSDAGVPLANPQSENEPSANERDPLRVFVSRERAWLAITGHEPDESKVFPTEFALLSIIASQKSRGIVQTDLVRLSGQDKRSVPKRTEMLQRKGYIEKRAVQVKSLRTSLCTLRKFVQDTPTFAATETPQDRGPGKQHEPGDIIDFRVFLDQLFEILRKFKVISRNDLKQMLGFADSWRWRILSRALRKLERIGCLKRVKAKSQYQDTMKALHPCVMLIRDPSERDLQLFHEDSRSLFTNLGQEDKNDIEFDGGGDAVAVRGETSMLSDSEIPDAAEKDVVEESGRILPHWTPDRNIHNLIFDVIDSAGTAGRTNLDTIHICFGGFFRRPLENALSRLVEGWQVSQPPHLRHLALVRDIALSRTITHYVHYSAKNFKKLVDSGQATWEAVEFAAKDTQSAAISVPPVDAEPVLDEHGLPLTKPTNDLVKNGNVRLQECIASMKPTDYLRSSSDPLAVMLADGTYTIRDGHQKLPPGALKRVKGPGRRHHRIRGTYGRPLSEHPDSTLLVPQERTVPDVDIESVSNEARTAMQRSRYSRKDPRRFIGMSEKEILEALGLDETWTEYNVLLIERPHPGVYVTPRGKRRPAGKRQGRPGVSRIAVFKSPKLQSLSWFAEKEAETTPGLSLEPRDRKVPATVTSAERTFSLPVPSPDTPSHQKSPSPPRPPKRSRQKESEASDIPAVRISVLATEEQTRPRKKPRFNENISVVIHNTVVASSKSSRTPLHDIVTKTSVSRKRGRPPRSSERTTEIPRAAESKTTRVGDEPITGCTPQGALVSEQTVSEELDTEPLSKRLRISSADHSSTFPIGPGNEGRTSTPITKRIAISPESHRLSKTAASGTLNDPHREESGFPEPSEPLPDIVLNEAELAKTGIASENTPTCFTTAESHPLTTIESQDVSQTAGRKFKSKKTRIEKGGSVAVLRRNIIMDIIQKSGGAFPSGTEIWYPFTTAWLKAKYAEKPDLRTVRSIVKHMIDAGKLRQLTFSGKDSRGVMTTRSIITELDIQPDDPLVKDMQAKILSSHPRFYIPPGTDIDARLTKNSRNFQSHSFGNMPKLPIEPDVTVQLHKKPAFVLAQEKRKEQSVQRRLFQNTEESAAAAATQPKHGVVRLMKLQRSSKTTPLLSSLTTSSIQATTATQPETKSLSEARVVPSQARQRALATADISKGASPTVVSRMKRLWIPISTMAPYAMLMNPKQVFHTASGTFTTDAGLAAYHKPAPPSRMTVPDLRRSLDELFDRTKRNGKDSSRDCDPRSSAFFSQNDVIVRWEQQNKDLFDVRRTELHYINQTVTGFFETVPIEGRIRFDVDEPPPPPIPTLQPMVTRQAARVTAPPSTSVETVMESSVKRRRHPAVPIPPSNRRLTKLTESETAGELAKSSTQPSAGRQILRRNRFTKVISDDLVRRITTALVVVRALAGGIEGRMIDWPILASVFPDFEPKVVQDRAKVILNRNRLQIAKMQSDFQERFGEAYENDQVPRIDYNNLEAYDWQWVIDWADSQLDIPTSQKVPDLPATREQFENLFEIRKDAPITVDDLYHQNQPTTVERKRTLFASVPFAIPLKEKTVGTTGKKLYLSRLETAKSWVRANIITPEETYKPAEARQALARLGEPLISEALRSLLTERAISMGNRGRITPGRNYDITELFLVSLGRKRAVDSGMLKRATRFKTEILDAEFQNNGVSDVEYNAEDGDMLVIINLAAEGRVVLYPRNPPRDKYGLTEGGYLTRLIDKDKLRFSVEVRPVSSAYIYGNPVKGQISRLPPPRGDMDLAVDPGSTEATPPQPSQGPLPGKVPIWYDVHFGFVKVIWDSVVAAVVGCVAARPGINAQTIANMVKPTMGAWEVELLLKWLADVGVLKPVEGAVRRLPPIDSDMKPGWVVREWWWMVVQ